jgi:hypothetical protein
VTLSGFRCGQNRQFEKIVFREIFFWSGTFQGEKCENGWFVVSVKPQAYAHLMAKCVPASTPQNRPVSA